MRTIHAWAVFFGVAVVVLAPACGGGAADDPRCVSLCTIKEPSTKGAGDICSQESADACREQCGAQIQDATTICADCLLEDAHFPPSEEGTGDFCESSATCSGDALLCTDSGPGGDCDYCEGDDAAREACFKKSHPRREVECKVDFRDPEKCTSACTEK